MCDHDLLLSVWLWKILNVNVALSNSSRQASIYQRRLRIVDQVSDASPDGTEWVTSRTDLSSIEKVMTLLSKLSSI